MDTEDLEARARRLRDALSFEERLWLLSGDAPPVRGFLAMVRRYNAAPIVAGALPRRGIAGVRFSDGPRGVVMGSATCFPVPSARAATFDPALEERVGDALGVEARALGANLFAGVCVNLLRHPGWGRAQESYGEDPHLLGEMGAAVIRGAQRHVMACVKHFAANSMENSRFTVDVRLDEQTLRDVYLPHFRRCVDEGVAAVMSAYNRVNGRWCGHHPVLLERILKDEWGFAGFVMSDFLLGVRGPSALAHGQDLEMPFHWRFRKLPDMVRAGRVSRARVDDAALRLLRQQLRFSRVSQPERYRAEAVAGPSHRRLARQVAQRSIVLLRNEGELLPFDPERVRRVAVIGALAARPNLGDKGSSRVHPPAVVTIADGMREAAARHGVELRFEQGRRRARLAALATWADAVVVVVGLTHRDEGEFLGLTGGDRRHLRLRGRDERLIAAVAAAGGQTAVVLMGGSAIETERWRRRVRALMMAWYPGMEGGHAVADVLFGDEFPGGRLPMTWPRSRSHLPSFRRFARRASYGPLHGYRLMEARGRAPAFPFGFGLGYTAIRMSEPRVGAGGVEVELRNLGERAGAEVVQVYVERALGSHRDRLRTLVGFLRVELGAGERRAVQIPVDRRLHDGDLWVGVSSAEEDLTRARR